MSDTLSESEEDALADALLELEIVTRVRLRRRSLDNPQFCADSHYAELRRGR